MKIIYNSKLKKYNIIVSRKESTLFRPLKIKFKGLDKYKLSIILLLTNINYKEIKLHKLIYKKLLIQLKRLQYILITSDVYKLLKPKYK